jgi:molybdenum cofactor cytidylyltransferase
VAAAAVVPAAGRAERFGGGKLLASVGGEPLLNRTLRSLIEGGIERVVVVIAPGAAFEPVALLRDARVTQVINPDPSRGMFSSIQTGLAAAEGDPILVLPADMPFVRPATVRAVAAAAADAGHIVSPRYHGANGHPVGLPKWLAAEIPAVDPSSTLALVIDSHSERRVEIEVDDPGVIRDVDAAGDLDP